MEPTTPAKTTTRATVRTRLRGDFFSLSLILSVKVIKKDPYRETISTSKIFIKCC